MPRAVVTGGAGFLGSHLCGQLLDRGYEVVAVDNLLTGRRSNLDDLAGRDGFRFVEADVVAGLEVTGPVDAVLHFASPASPPEYLRLPFETLDVGSIGTRHALDLARANGARFLLASTSEIYGDPEVHPQPESYWGNVNSTGPRAVYDEAKRFAEALSMAYLRYHEVDVKIARIFNTMGPRMKPEDGRVVSNFLVQAIRGRPLTVYGDGTQTRSFCYVEDEAAGLIALMESDHRGPMNIGNPGEFTILELAAMVREVVGVDVPIVHEALPADDPVRRRPDITLARTVLGWEPQVPLRDALERTCAWYRDELARAGTP
jgi:dTDP-glucose 4,6-dehydratase